MTNILFASNSISHFPGSEPKSEVWAFDANRVPYAIGAPALTMVSSPKFKASESNETWFHFRFGQDRGYYDDGPIFTVKDASGAVLLVLNIYNGDTVKTVFNAGGQTATKTLMVPFANQQMRTYDIKFGCTDLVADIAVYVNEMLLYTHSLSVTSKIIPRFLVLGGSDGSTRFSEIIVADGDTRNARLDLLRPVSAGAYGNWNGYLSALSDDDPTTGMVTTLPDQAESTILSPYKGAYNISNVVQVTTSVRGLNSPTKLKHFLRSSGVDYYSPVFTVPFSKDYQVTDWTVNPASSEPWNAEDVATMEFGFKSFA